MAESPDERREEKEAEGKKQLHNAGLQRPTTQIDGLWRRSRGAGYDTEYKYL
jgi:hypothetical protein